MPLYRYLCLHGHVTKRLLTVENFLELRQTLPSCSVRECNEIPHHAPIIKNSGVQTMEVLDDGIRPGVVERLADAERIFKEREHAHDQKYHIEDPEE